MRQGNPGKKVSNWRKKSSKPASVRELYRKLVSALHPDRESDPQERDKKTALMQRVNHAYDQKNLLLLLELQLEHIDQTTINNIAAGRLNHYNKILKEQLDALEHEILHIEDTFKIQFGIPPFAKISPSAVMRNLAADITGLQHAIRELEDDLLVFQDIKKLTAWPKATRRRQKLIILTALLELLCDQQVAPRAACWRRISRREYLLGAMHRP